MVASNDSSEEPASKKAKTGSALCGGGDGDGDDSIALARLMGTAWEHYRNYVDNEEEDEGGGGETDELAELLEILRDVVSPPRTPGESTRPPPTMPITSRVDLLPVLISVAHCVLADHAISDLLQQQQQQTSEKDKSTTSIHNASDELRQQIHQHLHSSLVYFPDNAAAWSMAANYVRMMPSNSSSSSGSSSLFLASVYARAAEKARAVRQRAIALLLRNDNDDDLDADESECCKEWIELLLLNQIAGVELMEEEDEEEKDDPEEDDEEEKEDCWTSSAVEGTARFMAAMLFSMAGEHDAAARQLRHFPAMTHRLHPNIWKQQQQQASLPVLSSSSSSSLPLPRTTTPPVSFQSPTGILPAHLYERLCQVFHPDAPYWTESDYANRGYYSYFMDLPDNSNNNNKSFTPLNLIEDVVCNHLLPLAQQQQQQLSKKSKDSTTDDDDDTPQPAAIVGYEWWVHTRPISANLGHNLHFDTDEALLAQDKVITHPVVSSVLYLTGGGGGGGGGTTIVLDQTPDAQTNAESAWLARPIDNSFMTFPGNLLHGVLPCPGKGGAGSKVDDDDDDDSNGALSVSATNGTFDDGTMLSTISKLLNDQSLLSSLSAKKEEAPVEQHRLTFMVGFWTRRVPDRMKGQKLYGPCGRIPPIQDEGATWVQAIHEGYNGSGSDRQSHERCADVMAVDLPRVAPAWEEINRGQPLSSAKTATTATTATTTTPTTDPPLEIPRAIDHRYFVADAPTCFRASLFERDECDDGNAEDESSVEVDDDEVDKEQK